jgi:ABC-type glycerol-3-phosphate transport system permease component
MSVSAALRRQPINVKRRRARFPFGRSFVSLILLALCALTVFPLIWILLTSLRARDTVFSGPFIPTDFTFAAYPGVWKATDFGLHFLNSLWITSATVIGVSIFACLSGYAFAKLHFPFKNVIYLALMSTLMMPSTALIIPLYSELKSIGLLDSQFGLVVLYVSGGAPFAMFLMRAFFETLPNELIQAARIDGAGELTILTRIVLPLARPGIATVVIFEFMATWNEFLYANTVLETTSKMPLQPILFGLLGQYSSDWPRLAAALMMAIVPVIAVFIWNQRYFVSGMTIGAVKD